MKTTTDYSINKFNKDAIVYIDATGAEIRLTVNDFGSREEFQKWKEWSDEDLHEIEKGDHVEESHSISENGISDLPTFSAEDVLVRREEIEGAEAVVGMLHTILPSKQYRRVMAYYILGMNLREIGEMEGVTPQVAGRIIHAALRRAQKRLATEKNF